MRVLTLPLFALSFAAVASAQTFDTPPSFVLREIAMRDAAFALLDPLPHRSAVAREDLDGSLERGVHYDDVPGGIVFGLAARTPEDWSDARIEWDAKNGVSLVRGDAALALPRASAAFLRACLAFAVAEGGHEVVDVAASGDVWLAPELVDTEAGWTALRADLAPLFFVPSMFGSKSTIVDRDVRFATDPSGERIRLEADVEVRFYRPDPDTLAATRLRTLKLDGPAGEESSPLASALHDARGLAAWIGFFRWARAHELAGLAELETALAAAGGERRATPRRIDRYEDRRRLLLGSLEAPGKVDDWMRRHRERALSKD